MLGKTAVGVEFVQQNTNYQVRARKEVILSAGSIKSPQLLMLSGIGPSAHLKSMGVSMVIEHIMYIVIINIVL